MSKRPKLAHVTWLDANSPADEVWTSVDSLRPRLVRVDSVGWVVKHNKTLIQLAGSLAEHAAGSLVTIPIKGIQKLRYLS